MNQEFEKVVLPELLLGRDRELRIVRETIQSAVNTRGVAQPQHILVVGPHGDGKTAVLAQTRADIENDPERSFIAFARIARLTPQLSDPSRFLAELIRQVEQRPPNAMYAIWSTNDENNWRRELDNLNKAMDERFGKDKGLLVVFIERFDDFLNNTFGDDESISLLRSLLQSHPRLMIIGTSHSNELQSNYDARIFQAFRNVDLPPFDVEIASDCFQSSPETQRPKQVKKLALFIKLAGGRGRRVYHAIEALSAKPNISMVDLLDATMIAEADRFSARLGELPKRELQIFDALVRGGEPASASTLADRLLTTQPSIARSVQLLKGRLDVITDQSKQGRTVMIQVADRLLSYWYKRKILFLPGDRTAIGQSSMLAFRMAQIGSRLAKKATEVVDSTSSEAKRFVAIKQLASDTKSSQEDRALILMHAIALVESLDQARDIAAIAEQARLEYSVPVESYFDLIEGRSSSKTGPSTHPDFIELFHEIGRSEKLEAA